MRRTLIALPALALILSACSGGSSSDTGTPAGEPVVVATTTQLGDVARQVAQCAGGEAATIMGVGDDPHDFSPSSEQIAQMVRAKLVVTNGLKLEGGMTNAIANAQSDGATILEIGPLIDPIPFGGGGDHDHGDHDHGEEGHEDHDHDHADHDHGEEGHEDHDHDDHDHDDHGHDHGSEDPHFWHDPARMAKAAEIIGAKLAELTGEDKYTSCGTDVSKDILETDAKVREILDEIPKERRAIVADHAAWGYFAAAYNFDVVGVAIPGGSTSGEPSSQEMKALVEAIQRAGVPAIFSNNTVSAAIMEALAAEVGEVKVVQLWEGSLGPEGSGADTYQTMMLTNAGLIADALK